MSNFIEPQPSLKDFWPKSFFMDLEELRTELETDNWKHISEIYPDFGGDIELV